MKPIVVLTLIALVGITPASPMARAAQRHQNPDSPKQDEPQRQAEPRRDEPSREGQPPARQAEPRRETTPPRRENEPPRQAPRRVLPPEYYRGSRAYAFPPISLDRGFYYHPYFGFYYGPYYGPFYPHPGGFAELRYKAAAIRLRVRPVETEVYVNGYYAGVVDDFDGVFQRLCLPAGPHAIELRLDGYRPFDLKLYVSAGDTRDLTHQMERLGLGEVSPPPPAPGRVIEDWTSGLRETTSSGERAASPFGILSLRTEPSDAQIIMDGEVWVGGSSETELVIHLAAGSHQLEVRKQGYQSFKTEIELSAGGTTRLVVRLTH